jgi:hypothetical protein
VVAKDSQKTSKTWSPGDPITVDKAIQNAAPDSAVSKRLKRAEDTHLAHPPRGQHPLAPTNHKPFNRQKKG